MRFPLAALLVLLTAHLAWGQTVYNTPVRNGKLEGPLDGNSQQVRWVSGLFLGAGPTVPITPAKIHFTDATTTAVGGINFYDSSLYRYQAGGLRLSGSLDVVGNITAPNIPATTQANNWTGTNLFTGAVTTLSGILMNNTGISFDVAAALATRTNLGLLPGTNIMAFDAELQQIAGIAPLANTFIMGNGVQFASTNAATAATALGVGTGSAVTHSSLTLASTLAVSGVATFNQPASWPNAVSAGTGLSIAGVKLYAPSGTTLATDQGLDATGDSRFRAAVRVDGTLSFAGDAVATLRRLAAGVVTTDGAFTAAGALTGASLSVTAPVSSGMGGTGLDNSALAADRFLYTSASGVFAAGTVTVTGRSVLASSSISNLRTSVLGLGGAALLNVGTTAGTVAAGDDSRLTNSRAPTGAASGVLAGTYPNPTLAAPGAIATSVDWATEVPVLNFDADGRLVSVTSDPVDIEGAWQPPVDSVTLGTHTAGNYVATIVGGLGMAITGSGTETAAVTIQTPQDIRTTASPTFVGLALTTPPTLSDTSAAWSNRVLRTRYTGTPPLALAVASPEAGVHYVYDGATGTPTSVASSLTIPVSALTGNAARPYSVVKTGTGWLTVAVSGATTRFNVDSNDVSALPSGTPVLLIGARNESLQTITDATSGHMIVTGKSAFRTASVWAPTATAELLNWDDSTSVPAADTRYMTETLYVDLRNLVATELADINMPPPADIWQNSTFRFVVPGNGSVAGATAERVEINFATVDDAGLAANETVTLQPKTGSMPNAVELRCVQRGALWGWVYHYIGPSESGSVTIGDVSGFLASEAQAIAGTANDVLMTPLRTADNVTARLATNGEAIAGSNNTKLMTPLRTAENVTTRIATNGEAIAGSNNTKLMTPLRVAEAIAAAAAGTTGGRVAVRVYTVPATWAAPPDLTRLDVIAVGGGGAGGAGRRGAAGTIRSGGAGGAAGSVHAATFYAFSPEMLALTITPGAGGTGGVAGTSAGTTSVSGGAGGAGDDSTVFPTGSTKGIVAKGGAGGAGGGTGVSSGGGDFSLVSTVWGGEAQGTLEGADSVVNAAAVDAVASVVALPTGGGAGGSITALNVIHAPSRGGQHGSTLLTGGAQAEYYYADGGLTTTPSSTRKGWGADSGTYAELPFRPSVFGIGGAGGAASDGSLVISSAVGGKGGDGLEYGAGGGGGGCGLAVAGSTGGQGGRGANGVVILIEYYAAP